MKNNYTCLISLLDRVDVKIKYFFEQPTPQNLLHKPKRSFSINFNGYESVFDFKNDLQENYNNLVYEMSIGKIHDVNRIHIIEDLHNIEKENTNEFIDLHEDSELLVTYEEYGLIDEETEIQKYIEIQINYLAKVKLFFNLQNKITESTTVLNESDKGCSAYESALLMHYIFEELNCHKKFSQKAKLTTFLTGKNCDNTRKSFPNVVKPDSSEVTDEHKKSIETISKLFKDLSLDSIVKKIHKDLN